MATKTSGQAGHSVVTTTAVELLGVVVFAMLAGINDDMGNVMVVLMWGFLLGWMLIHTSQLKEMVGKL
jgi:hypothetical protein